VAESLVVQSKVKEAVKGLELKMSSELPDALNAKLRAMLEEAAGRARANGRATLRPHDL